MTKTPLEIVPKTIATLASLPIRPNTASESPKSSPNVRRPIRRPCETIWQRKWLGLDVTCPQIQELANAAQQFAARWIRNEPNPALLVLVGNSNAAKTHTAKAIHRFARHAAFTAYEKGGWKGFVPGSLYLSWPETTDQFKAGNYGVLSDCFETALLVLDDIGAENDPSRNAADKFCQILSRREKQFTLITTNIQPTVWADRFDVRIADRLLRNSVIVDLSSVPSYALS